MEEKLNAVICKALRLPSAGLSDDLKLGEVPTWDSMSHMDLIVGIEEAFHVQFTGDEIADMIQIGTIRAMVKAKVGSQWN